MKRLGSIYSQICSYENLLYAFGRVQRGKQLRGDICAWREKLEENTRKLSQQMRNMEFSFGDYKVFKVYDPKERTIYAASVRERIIHHAVIHLCGERLEKALIDDSYACRRGKGQLAAVKRACNFAGRHSWCLKMDIKSYFDSIEQARMMELLAEKIKDSQLLELFRQLLYSYSTTPGRGLPIGNLTSQYFANLYLDAFDRWACSLPGCSYLRYMDDMLLFGDKCELLHYQREAGQLLQELLSLQLKHGGELHRSSDGVEFLGYRIFPGYFLLSRRSKRRFIGKSRVLEGRLLAGEIREDMAQERMTALYAFICHASTYNFRKSGCNR